MEKIKCRGAAGVKLSENGEPSPVNVSVFRGVTGDGSPFANSFTFSRPPKPSAAKREAKLPLRPKAPGILFSL